MAEALKRPGGELASRPLHFFWVVDCSGSMYGEKIGTVNHAIQSTIPEMVDAAKDNPNAQLLVRTLKFSTGATWVTPDPVNIEDFAWDDLDAGGVTDLGKAFEMLAAQLIQSDSFSTKHPRAQRTPSMPIRRRVGQRFIKISKSTYL